MYSKNGMFLVAIIGFCGSVEAHTPTTKADEINKELLAPGVWDERYFASLSDDNKKVVLSIIKSNKQLLDGVKRDVFNGADAFLKAYADIVQYHAQSMTLFVPTQQQTIACTMLPCADSYQSALEIYQTNLPIIQALEIIPPIYIVWQQLSEFIPTDSQADVDALKKGITKALRSKELKNTIKQTVTDQVQYLDAIIDYITAHYDQLVREQEQLELQVAELIATMKQEQDVAI